MNIIILKDGDKDANSTYKIADNRADHIRTILKGEVGQSVEIGLLNGQIGKAEISEITNQFVSLKIIELKDPQIVAPELTLICALPRPQTLKKVLLTSAMMGVSNIHFIKANRVEKSYFHSPLLQPEKYTPYLIEGLSQGKSVLLPEVKFHERFKVFFEDYFPNQIESENQTLLKLLPDLDSSQNLIEMHQENPERIIIAIGPEGGWVPFETELIASLGFNKFSLSRWTLRVEHAVTAVLSQIELLKNKA